jgi:hypothetical protein
MFPYPVENWRNAYRFKDKVKIVKYPQKYCREFVRQLFWRCATNASLLSNMLTFYSRGTNWVVKNYFVGAFAQESL